MLQHVRSSLSVAAMGEERRVSVDVLLDSRSGIIALPEAFLEEVRAGMSGAHDTDR